MNESRFEQYLDQLSSGKIHKEDISLCEDLSEEELRGISFAHTLKSMSNVSEPDQDFVLALKEKLHADFHSLYEKKYSYQITRVSETFSEKPFWSFLYPVGIMALLLVSVSLGFLNYGSWQVAQKNNVPISSLKTTSQENVSDEIFLALNSNVDEFDVFLMQGEDNLSALTNDLFVFESSFDGELTTLQEEFDTMLDSTL